MGKEQEPYLHDVQVGDKLYNFLEDNEEYVVVHISEEYEEITIRLSDLPQGVKDPKGFEITINPDGTMERGFTVPHFLYAPVDVLDPKNLPPRPWKPDEDEWIWGRFKGGTWILARFYRSDKNGFWCHHQDKSKCFLDEIAPFKGELPPRLEEE